MTQPTSAKGDKKIEEYLDAKREVAAIKKAIEHDGDSPNFRRALYEASIRMKLAYSKMTGGELARARRKEQEWNAPVDARGVEGTNGGAVLAEAEGSGQE